MENLRQRVDPKTGLVRPRWKQMAWDLGVSRSTIARQMAGLYACGAYEKIYVKVRPKVTICYYRIKNSTGCLRSANEVGTSLFGEVDESLVLMIK